MNHAQPFSVVEQQDFKEYSASFKGNYELPSIINDSEKLNSEEGRRKKRVGIQVEIRSADIALWTDIPNMRTSASKWGYMVVTIHCITSD